VVVAGKVLGAEVGFDVSCEVAISLEGRSVRKQLIICFVSPITMYFIRTQLKQLTVITSKTIQNKKTSSHVK